MPKLKVGRLLFASLICLGLTACGSSIVGVVPASPVVPSPAKTPPTTLNGNWLLTGSRVPAVYPTISTSLHVDGNTISGLFTFDYQCTSSGLSGVGSSGLQVQGTIANDGSFQAATGTVGGAGGLGSFSISLTGNSPIAATPSVWTGTYSLAVTPGSLGASCLVAQAGNFSASSIAPLTGTYTGVLMNPGSFPGAFGAGATVSVQISQGSSALMTRGPTSVYVIPLTASLAIANSACALSTSTTGALDPSTISGDRFDLFFAIPGPPIGVLSGTLNDVTANTFVGDLSTLATAIGCGGIAMYSFTRQ